VKIIVICVIEVRKGDCGLKFNPWPSLLNIKQLLTLISLVPLAKYGSFEISEILEKFSLA